MPSPKSAVRETVVYKTVVKGGVSASSIIAALGSQAANQVLASPNGSSGAMSVRALVSNDIPNLAASKITSGIFGLARGGTGADLSATGGTGHVVMQESVAGVFTVRALLAADIPTLTLSKISDAGTIASQAASNVNISGGAIASVAISGGSLNNTPIGGSTPSSGIFTTLQANGNTTLGDASGDSITINAGTVSLGTTLNFDSNTFVINPSTNRVGVNNASPTYELDVTGAIRASTILHTTSLRGSATGIGQIGLTGSTTNLITLLPENATQRTLNIRGFTSHSATLTEWQDSGQNILSQVAANGAMTAGVRDAGTNDTVRALTVRRNSSGTPAANFATGIDFLLENASQVENRRAASLDVLWNTPTNNAEIPDVILSAYYANGTQREAIRIRGGSSATQLGFFGVTPVARQALGAWAGLTTDQKLDALRDLVTNLGLGSYT